jgi:dual specificity MAP kinase phosphatase
MATVTIQPPLIRHSSAPPQHPPALTLDASKFKAGPVPNKHLPYCSPGPALSPLHGIPVTPPASPPSSHSSLSPTSLLDPNEGKFPNIIEVPPAYSIDASILAAALDGLAKQVLPDPKQVFPWLHGLHPENQVQLAFFVARRKASRATPDGLRSITIVKAGGDLTRSVLKGSLSPDEVLCSDAGKDSVFLDSDPKHGFSVRNFHIQAAKMAKVSDIVVYGEGGGADPEVKTLAKRISQAQRGWAAQNATRQRESPKFHTLVISSKWHSALLRCLLLSARGTVNRWDQARSMISRGIFRNLWRWIPKGEPRVMYWISVSRQAIMSFVHFRYLIIFSPSGTARNVRHVQSLGNITQCMVRTNTGSVAPVLFGRRKGAHL